MFQYILMVVGLTVLTIFAYIKLKYPFWNIQPVYHSYDYWRFLYKTPFIVYKYRPVKTKFTDLIHVQTVAFPDLSPAALDGITNLLQCYYIPTDRIIYTIGADHLSAIHAGQSEPAFVSVYNDIHYEYHPLTASDASSNLVVQKKPVGCITSRPLRFLYRRADAFEEQLVYYTDFLCVNREHNQRKINRHLLQTHEYNQRLQNPKSAITVIRQETDLFAGVVPFVQFKAHTFHLRDLKFPKLPDGHHIRPLCAETLDKFVDFFYSKPVPDPKTLFFDTIIVPEVGNITSQIKNGLLYGYCLFVGDEVLAFYFLKDVKIVYEEIDGNTSQCVASVMNCRSLHLFYNGFLHALKLLLEKRKDNSMLIIDEIGHNVNLMSMWRYKNTPVFTNDAAYYLYNYICPGSPLPRERCFLLA